MASEPPSAGARDIAILTFKRVNGAERAYADASALAGDAPWPGEVVFVEVHHKHRIAVRGTFAGRYLDVVDVADAIGRSTAEGAVAGGLVGLAFGPAGLAAGLVGGGMIGGSRQSRHIEAPRGALFDEIREQVPEGCSALVIYAEPEHVDAMVAAFGERPEHVQRHRPSPEEAAALEAAVREAPAAAAPPLAPS